MEELFEQLDKLGCEYGRNTKEKLFCVSKELEILKHQKAKLEADYMELKSRIDRLLDEFSTIKTKIAWIVGALAVAGSIAGQLLVTVFKSLGGQ